MDKSEQTDQVFSDFILFQGEVEDVKRDAQAHKYKYAKLEQVVQTRKLLSKYGLGVTQLPGKCRDGVLELENIVVHKSGQWFSKVMEMPIGTCPPGMSLAQYIGSLLSYERRYGWLSTCGLAQEDDDAQLPQSKQQATQKQQHNAASLAKPVNISLAGQLKALTKKYNVPEETLKGWRELYNVESLKDLSDNELIDLIELVKAKFEV